MQSLIERLVRRRFLLASAVLHLVVIAGLVAAIVVTPVAEAYFTRGVEASAEYSAIPHTGGNPMGINTFLNLEPDPAVVERSLDMIADGGYGYIRQIFGWYEIEPQPGVFVYEDGQSTWAKYDRIVNLAHERGIEIIARLEKPPPWSKANQPNPQVDGPPDRLSDYAEYVEQVVSRYRGKINYVQIWNEPNLANEWGAKPIDPAGYVRLLEAGYRAAKRANPEVTVLLAGLAPTDQTGPENLSDLLFLERVYELGGASFFDIATCMVYGYGYSPFDRRVEWARNNFSRPIQTREIMVRNGDEETPLWGVEYGWVSLPDDWQGQPSPWGDPVSEEQQAEYLVEGYLRAQREWPWMGVMAVWTFRFPLPPDHPDEVANPTRGFALVEHDFTPSPAYRALKRAAPVIQRVGTGAYTLTDDQQRRLLAGEPVLLAILGERLDIAASGIGTLEVMVDGEERDEVAITHPVRAVAAAGANDVEPELVTVAEGLSDAPHDITLQLDPAADPARLEVAGFVVSRSAAHTWIYPWITAALALMLALNLASAAWLAWSERLGVARRVAAWWATRRELSSPAPSPGRKRRIATVLGGSDERAIGGEEPEPGQ